MKIALIGYGKMGKAIEDLAVSRGHEIVLRVSSGNIDDFNVHKVQAANVAIEFTTPDSAYENISSCIYWGIPVVSGTTGWLEKKDDLDKYCIRNNGCYLYSSNFSIGVNIFFNLNRYLAQMMSHQKEYSPKMKEIHHVTKLDAPSGTAITLAEDIIQIIPEYTSWKNENNTNPPQISIFSERIEKAPGTHIINYSSEIDEIEIKHEAKSRIGFALGAILAAEYIQDKKGIFTMEDVIKLPDL